MIERVVVQERRANSAPRTADASSHFPLTTPKISFCFRPVMIDWFRTAFSGSKLFKELEVWTKTKSSETGLLVKIGVAFLTTPDDAQPSKDEAMNKSSAKVIARFKNLPGDCAFKVCKPVKCLLICKESRMAKFEARSNSLLVWLITSVDLNKLVCLT